MLYSRGPGVPGRAGATGARLRAGPAGAGARPGPGTTDLVGRILAGYAYHLNVMPLDAVMPDPGQLVPATDIVVRPGHPAR